MKFLINQMYQIFVKNASIIQTITKDIVNGKFIFFENIETIQAIDNKNIKDNIESSKEIVILINVSK